MLIALVLFGCTDDAATCQRLTGEAKSFKTRAQCEMSIDSAFDSDIVLSADYPTVIAKCMPGSQLGHNADDSVKPAQPVGLLASR
ncbi:MAG: hypothetical protein HKN60_04835 [Rhizobiales bacterium]|nr:hypothetical protein [Hyphomicrobiales bacterium]